MGQETEIQQSAGNAMVANTNTSTTEIKKLLSHAMGDPDRVVIVLEYCDKKGVKTSRVVSPIRFTNSSSFLALCLCREEPRRFDLNRCSNVRMAPAHEFEMPVPVGIV